MGEPRPKICPGCGGEGMFHKHPCPHLAEGFRRAAPRKASPKPGHMGEDG
jgi:DnaJ-class molecular chaperone